MTARPGPNVPFANDDQFRLLVESVTDYAIFMLDPQGLVVTWNRGAERLKGYGSDEIIGRHFSVFYTPEDLAASVPAQVLEGAAREGRYEAEGWRRRKDGSAFWANVVVTPVHDDGGTLVGFAKVTRDLTERRRADLALEAQARRLNLILDCLAEGVVVCDTTGTFTHRNRMALQLAGPERQDGDGIDNSVKRYGIFRADGVTPLPPDESTLRRALDGVASDEVGMFVRNEANPDGVHLSVTTRPLMDDSGAILGAVLVAHDVTRSRAAEHELVRQRTLLRSVLDCVVEAVSVFDTAGRLLLSNPAFDQMIGKAFAAPATVDERSRHYGLFTADGQRRLAADESPAYRAIRGEPVEDLELIVRTPATPADIVVSANAKCLRDATGAVIGAVVTGRDVTSRKHAERTLLEQKDLLSSILDCLGEAVVVYDPEGRILLTNRAAARVMGGSADGATTLDERLPKNGFFSIDGTRRLERRDTALGQALEGHACDDHELLVRTAARPDGIAFSTSGRTLVGENGTILGAVVTARDITARRAVERDKERLLRDLTRSNEELAQFAHVASHDLRAPLRAIDSLAQWLEEDLRPHFTPETAEQMRLLQSRVRRLEILIADLLAFARVGHSEVEVGPVDVDALVAEAVELVGPPSSFRIVTEVAVHGFVSAALPLKRVLLNLLANAVKHHDRAEGEIRISVRDNQSFVELEVTDDGPGIPPPFHQKVFEVFQTLKPRDTVEGSGMGLAFVKKIVEQAQGSVHLVSTGRGTTFRIEWPKVWLSPPGGP